MTEFWYMTDYWACYPTDKHTTGMTGESNQPDAPLTVALFQAGIKQLSTDLGGKIDKISEEVSNLSKKLSEVENTVDFNSGKIGDLEKELPKIKEHFQKEIKRLEDKLTMSEIYNRKMNLLFYGIRMEQKDESTAEVLRKNLVKMGMDKDSIAKIKFVNAHRLPSRSAARNESGSSEKEDAPTPIIAKFVYMEDRNAVLNAYEQFQRNVRGAPRGEETAAPRFRISVRTDLPPQLKARRGVLAAQAYKLRREKGLATKISVQGAKVVLFTREKGTTQWKAYEE